MRTRVVLTNSDVLVSILDYCSAVVIYIQVVRRRKYCNDGGKLLRWCLSIHHVSEIINSVGSDTAHPDQELLTLHPELRAHAQSPASYCAPGIYTPPRICS